VQVNRARSDPARSFTNQARRAEIVEHAIATIAEVGYAKASFVRIARHAGLSSTRLISYHFAGKEELTDEVARRILTEFAGYVRPRVEAEHTCAAQLRAFLEANVDFMGARRAYMRALSSILDHTRDASALTASIAESDLDAIEQLLRTGQRAGEFRDFDTRVLAVAVLALRNAVAGRLSAQPDLDLEPYRQELVTLITLATRREAT
jgi:AcrR family transcriptional regulator